MSIANSLVFLDRVLRVPESVAHDCRTRDDLQSSAATALTTIVVGNAAFGAAVGAFSCATQVAYSAAKLPLVMLITFALSTPAFYAVAAVFGRTWSMRAITGLMLAAGTRFALVLFAAAPVLWLTIDLGASYHVVRLAATILYGLAGLAGLVLLLRSIDAGPGKGWTLGLVSLLFLMLAAQTAWVLRPYIADPTDLSASFIANRREGGLFVQLFRSVILVISGRP